MFRALRRRRGRRPTGGLDPSASDSSEAATDSPALAAEEQPASEQLDAAPRTPNFGSADPSSAPAGAEAPDGGDDEDDALGSRPLAELMLTDVVDPSDTRSDIDLASIEGVREVALRIAEPLPEVRTLPDVDDPRDRIAHASIFSSLAIQTIERLKRHVRVERVAEGKLVFAEGDPSDALYIVARGAVVPEAGGSPPVRLSVLGEGECFGEVGLLAGGVRSASVRALVDCELLAVDRTLFARLTKRDPNLLRALSRCVRERIVDRLLKTNILFSSLEPEQRREIVQEFRLIEVQDGTEIVEQGRPAPAFFLILSGAARVLRCDENDEKELATLGPGGFFGEMSLLEHAPAVAWVVALGACWMLALPRSRFEHLVANGPGLAQHLNGVALMRHHQNHLALREATPVHGRVDLF